MFAFAIIGVALMFLFPGGRADKYSYKSTQQSSTDDTSEDSQEVEDTPSLSNTLS